MRTTTEAKVKAISQYLEKEYGVISEEWKMTLDLLGDNIDTYEDCKEVINQVGIYDVETGRKNPLLSTMKDLQATILKQVQHFGLSPYAASKLKNTPNKEDETEDEMFLNDLMMS